MKCKAKTKRGHPCKFNALPGKEVCRYHGGLTPGGSASPHFKHGRYSKYLPAELMGKFNEARRDPDLLSLRDEISLNDVLILSLVEKLPSGGARQSWTDLQSAWKELIAAQRRLSNARDDAERSSAQHIVGNVLQRMNTIIEDGAGEAKVWNDIIVSIDNRRKLAQTEARRLADMEQYITSEKAIALVYAILDIIRRNVPDKGALSSIATEVRSLITIPEKTS